MDTNTRSISGHHIPFSRDSHNNDAFQDMTAFSPPSHGADNWLNRYSNIKKETKSEESKSSGSGSKIVEKKKFTVPKANQLEDPCKKYIETSEIPVKSNKSLGTDDHFKSAVCSKNLLKVCEKLMTKREPNNNTESFDSAEDDFDAELSLMNEKSRMEFYRNKYGNRRDSQSLPASPKMDRKNQSAPVSHNPYFTITKQPEARPESSISFLTSLFGITAVKHPAETQTNLAQKYEVQSVSKSKTTNSSSSFASGGEFSKSSEQPQQQTSSRQMTPKPHPYREMNIFSPTSM